MAMKTEFKLVGGGKISRLPNKPIIGITDKGVNTYLWIGNDAADDKFCFATLSGVKTLESLACGILTALGHDSRSIKNNIYKKYGKSKKLKPSKRK